MPGDLSAHQGRTASFVYRWFTDQASLSVVDTQAMQTGVSQLTV